MELLTLPQSCMEAGVARVLAEVSFWGQGLEKCNPTTSLISSRVLGFVFPSVRLVTAFNLPEQPWRRSLLSNGDDTTNHAYDKALHTARHAVPVLLLFTFSTSSEMCRINLVSTK